MEKYSKSDGTLDARQTENEIIGKKRLKTLKVEKHEMKTIH